MIVTRDIRPSLLHSQEWIRKEFLQVAEDQAFKIDNFEATFGMAHNKLDHFILETSGLKYQVLNI